MTSIDDSGEVEFRFFRPGVNQVCVVGDFTAWKANPLEMAHEGDGWWVLRLNMAHGEYRFRYIADGTWFTDFASHGVELTRQQWNSVLVVAPRPGKLRLVADRPTPMRLAA